MSSFKSVAQQHGLAKSECEIAIQDMNLIIWQCSIYNLQQSKLTKHFKRWTISTSTHKKCNYSKKYYDLFMHVQFWHKFKSQNLK